MGIQGQDTYAALRFVISRLTPPPETPGSLVVTQTGLAYRLSRPGASFEAPAWTTIEGASAGRASSTETSLPTLVIIRNANSGYGFAAT